MKKLTRLLAVVLCGLMLSAHAMTSDCEVKSVEAISSEGADHALLHLVQKIKKILKSRGTINQRDETGKTFLHHAVLLGHLPTVNFLIRKGAFVDSSDNDRNKPSDLVAAESEIFHYLEVNERLFVACKSYGEFIQEALDYGAYPFVRNADGCIPLHLAAEFNDDCAVFTQLKAMSCRGINSRNSKGLTALHKAAFGRKSDNVRLLLCNGADLYAKDYEHGRSPLHYAIDLGNELVIEVFVEHLSECDRSVDIPDNDFKTPLFLAVERDYPALVQLLLDAGADPDLIAFSGISPRFLALRDGKAEISDLFFQHDSIVCV